MSNFSKKISPFVEAELKIALHYRKIGDFEQEFKHLENAHVLGQESTFWHVKVHMMMLGWGLRHFKVREIFGQVFRVGGAATKTVFGLIPSGNTGGSNVSPFRAMPINREHQLLIDKAKSNV